MTKIISDKKNTVVKPSLLIVDDESSVRKSMTRILTKEGYEVNSVDEGKKVFKGDLLQKTDVILLDLFLGKESGFDVLEKVREVAPNVVVIVITGHGDVRSAVEAMKKGAYQFIEKPSSAKTIIEIIKRATYQEERYTGADKLQSVVISLGKRREQFLYGKSLESTMSMTRKVAKGGDATVLIQGESGTGKELLARYIHGLSSRSENPFIPINCAALPKELMESELFGYKKGAFTGALASGKVGYVEKAEGGTMLLDEVGELPPEMQTKLLRFLETKEYYQLGSTDLRTSDVRIIASTNADLSALVKEKRFRKDLFYRLNVVHLTIPALSSRKDDIIPLAEYFLEFLNRKYNKHIKGFKERVKAYLTALPWERNAANIKIVISDLPADTLYKPSVDVMLNSVADIYGSRILSVIMTGMGKDGLEGSKKIHENYGKILSESEESCVVYGMPKAVVDAGITDRIESSEGIAEAIVDFVSQ